MNIPSFPIGIKYGVYDKFKALEKKKTKKHLDIYVKSRYDNKIRNRTSFSDNPALHSPQNAK